MRNTWVRLVALFLLLVVGFTPLAQAAQIARQHTTEISNGQLANATDVSDELNSLVNESNSQDTRLTNIESNAMTISGVKTFASIPLLPASDPTTSNQAVRKAYVDNNFIGPSGGTMTGALTMSGSSATLTLNGNPKAALQAVPLQLLAYLHGSAPPVYSSSTGFTVANILEISSDSTTVISKSSSSTVSTSTVGAVNGIAQSANQTGTVAVTNGSATITGTGTSFSSVFQAGDVICVNTAQCRRISTVSSNTSMTAESNFSSTVSGVTFKRGGLAPNTWYYLYAIGDSTGNSTTGLLLSTREVAHKGDTLVDLPTGYDKSREFVFALRSDSSTNILPFRVGMGPYGTTIYYLDAAESSPYSVASNSGNTSGVATDCSTIVPPVSREAIGTVRGTQLSTGTTMYVRETGRSANIIASFGNSSAGVINTLFIPLNSSQSFDLVTNNNNTGATVSIVGYVITDIQ